MYCTRGHQSYNRKRYLRSYLIKTWLLGFLSLTGCFHTTPIREEIDVASSAKRPIDIDASAAEEIGREALEKIGFNEIIKLSEKAGFIEYKSDVRIQLASYESIVATGFVPVFSRYAAAAAVTSQADSPLPGPADLAALGVVVVGLLDAGLLDGYLLNTVGDWLVGTRGKPLMSQAKPDDPRSWGHAEKEGRGRGANRADGRMVDDAARHAGVSDRAGLELADQFKSQGAR